MVDVDYEFSGMDEAVLHVGFNTGDDVDDYFLDEKTYVVTDKKGSKTFEVGALVKEWGEDGDFNVYVNISKYPHDQTWTPLDSDTHILNTLVVPNVTDAEKLATAKTVVQALNLAWDTDLTTTTISTVNTAIGSVTLPAGVTAVAAEGITSNAGKVIVTITCGTETDATIVLEAQVPQVATVSFTKNPTDSTLYVAQGTAAVQPETNGTYKLETGYYTYTASKGGYETKTESFSITSADITTGKDITVTLEPVQQETVSAEPAITTTRQEISPTLGTRVEMTVEASSPDGGTLTYQWYTAAGGREGDSAQLISDATQETYVISSVTAADQGDYRVVVTNTKANASSTSKSCDAYGVFPITHQVLVSAITVSSAGNATSVVNGETLQMSADVTPTNATINTVVWSVDTLAGGTASLGVDGVLDAQLGILVHVPFGTDLTDLVPTIGVSANATFSLDEGFEANNFSNTVFYSVTSQDGSLVNHYIVIVEVDNLVAPKVALAFTKSLSDITLTVFQRTVAVQPETNGSYKLEPGEYTYTASKTGYATETASFSITIADVTAGRTIVVALVQKKALYKFVNSLLDEFGTYDYLAEGSVVEVENSSTIIEPTDMFSYELVVGIYSYQVTASGFLTKTGIINVALEDVDRTTGGYIVVGQQAGH